MTTKYEALKLALEALEPFTTPNWAGTGVDKANEAITALREALNAPLAEQPAPATELREQEHVERGGLRFYTNGIERQHWKADGSIDFKDKQGNVTMTIAAGSITSPQPSKPLTDEEIKELYGDDDNFRMTKKYVVAFARAIEAAHGIKENT